MERKAIDVLEALSVTVSSVRTRLASLAAGQRQSVAVARSVMSNSRVVLPDKRGPGHRANREALDLIKRLRQQGFGLIISATTWQRTGLAWLQPAPGRCRCRQRPAGDLSTR
jgi:D-xylose transport system ATP-binding protein